MWKCTFVTCLQADVDRPTGADCHGDSLPPLIKVKLYSSSVDNIEKTVGLLYHVDNENLPCSFGRPSGLIGRTLPEFTNV